MSEPVAELEEGYRRVVRVILDGPEAGVWLNDGNRLVVGNMSVTSRPGGIGPPQHMLTVNITSAEMAVDLERLRP